MKGIRSRPKIIEPLFTKVSTLNGKLVDKNGAGILSNPLGGIFVQKASSRLSEKFHRCKDGNFTILFLRTDNHQTHVEQLLTISTAANTQNHPKVVLASYFSSESATFSITDSICNRL